MATSSEAFKAFKSTGPIVFIDSKKDGIGNAPKPVAEIRRETHMGNTIPMVMVTTADLSKGLKGFSYKDLSDTRKAARDLKKEIKEMDVVGSSQNAEEEAEETSLLAEKQAWTNADGKTITAAIVKADDATVTFQMPDGKTVAYPVTKLSASSQEAVKALLEK
ncbi:MAG: hypothetical protein ACSHYB_11555 [Roseibacillus sp.]